MYFYIMIVNSRTWHVEFLTCQTIFLQESSSPYAWILKSELLFSFFPTEFLGPKNQCKDQVWEFFLHSLG